MSIDPINPGYLDHVFDGALREPRRVERISGQNERERSEEESARRRNQERDADATNAEHDDEAEDDGGDDERAGTGGGAAEDQFETALIEAELVEDEAVTVSPPALAPSEHEFNAEGDEDDEDDDAVVVEFDEGEPAPPVERRINPQHRGHVDFEA